jgi:hypothetical protein
MKKIFLSLLICSASLNAAITFNINAAQLSNSGGTPVPTNGLVLLVTDTLGNGFSTLTDGTSLNLNSFINSDDDQILARWALGASSLTAGAFSDTVSNLNPSGNWNVGDPLALLWFPTLTTSSTTASANVSYGLYSNTAAALDPSLDGGERWVTPGDGTFGLNFFTTSFGGSHDNTSGNASLTVAGVPEPSRSLLGLIGLGVLALRRRRC